MGRALRHAHLSGRSRRRGWPSPAMTTLVFSSKSTASGYADAEHEERAFICPVFQDVARLAHQVGDVDRRQRIGAFEHERVAGGELRQRLARFQRRQRTFEAAQIENGFGHETSEMASSELPIT